MDWLGDFDFPSDFSREGKAWFCGECVKNGKKKRLFRSAESLMLNHTLKHFVKYSNRLFSERDRIWLAYYGYKKRQGGFVSLLKLDTPAEVAAVRAGKDTRYLIPLKAVQAGVH